jgi:hypothetical protein
VRPLRRRQLLRLLDRRDGVGSESFGVWSTPNTRHGNGKFRGLRWARKRLMHRSKERLFDHLVGAHEERRRDRQAKRFGSPHVDSEVETRGTLER